MKKLLFLLLPLIFSSLVYGDVAPKEGFYRDSKEFRDKVSSCAGSKISIDSAIATLGQPDMEGKCDNASFNSLSYTAGSIDSDAVHLNGNITYLIYWSQEEIDKRFSDKNKKFIGSKIWDDYYALFFQDRHLIRIERLNYLYDPNQKIVKMKDRNNSDVKCSYFLDDNEGFYRYQVFLVGEQSSVFKEGNGKMLTILLQSILEPEKGTVMINGPKPTLQGITETINKDYKKNFSQEQVKQIYKISTDKNVNIIDVIEKADIDKDENIVFKSENSL